MLPYDGIRNYCNLSRRHLSKHTEKYHKIEALAACWEGTKRNGLVTISYCNSSAPTKRQLFRNIQPERSVVEHLDCDLAALLLSYVI